MANFTVGDGVRFGCGSLIVGLVFVFLVYAFAMGSCAAMFSGGGSSKKTVSVFDKKELNIPGGLSKSPKVPPRAKDALIPRSFDYLYQNMRMSTNSFGTTGTMLETIARRYEDLWRNDVVKEKEARNDRNLMYKFYGHAKALPAGEYFFHDYVGYKDGREAFANVDFLSFFTFCHNVSVNWQGQRSNAVIKGLAQIGWVYNTQHNQYWFDRYKSGKITDYLIIDDPDGEECNSGH